MNEEKKINSLNENVKYKGADNEAYVTAVVGAGGKSGYIRNLAKKLSDMGKRVCITTTTHIFKPDISSARIFDSDQGRIFYGSSEDAYYVGRISENPCKLTYPGDSIFSRLLREFDCLLVEADGSRHLPAKIPMPEREPVIPPKADEIVVIMGKHATGKRLSEVCHRYSLQDIYAADEIVTEEMLEDIAETFYIRPLSERYPGIRTEYVLSERKLAFIVMASGYGRRFGENKLLKSYHGIPLYKHIVYELLKAAELIKKNMNLASELIIATRYDEILEDEEIIELSEQGKIRLCVNTEYEEGIAGSVRLGARTARELCCTEYIYCAADMPLITAEDMYEYVEGYIYSGKHFAVMDDGAKISNPGSISSAYYDEIMAIKGDRGGMQVIRKHPDELYHHPIVSLKLKDIDTKEDLFF